LLRLRYFALLIVAVMLAAGPAFAKDDPLEQRYAQAQAKIAALKAGVDDLVVNYADEIDERERLMLRRRFVEGREFFYELHDYRGAAEVFYSIVNHPLAATLPSADAATFYLAESLFHGGYLPEAKLYYQKLLAKGPGDYYAMSLIRQIEIAVARRNYSEAERYYAVLLSQLPAEEDGSLGRYIIGKSYYLRGEAAKAVEIFDSVPETGSYYATAQYYAAVIFLKQNNYREAVNRLRKLNKVLKEDVANKERLFSLTHLALARIYYEMNDFPQAMANYRAVDEGDQSHPDALYESIWVFITRNDYLLKAIEDERSNYEGLLFEHAQFQETVEFQKDTDSVAAVAEQTDALRTDLDEMSVTFDEIDASLTQLQEEAVTSFNKLVIAAPNSPLIPEAELLVGNIYSQAEEYEKAEQWFTKLRKKYEDYYASIANARPRYTDADYVRVVADASDALTDGTPLSRRALKGVPEEAAYWLAADKQVRQIFSLYTMVNRERLNVRKMRELIQEIEAKLREMEMGIEFPFLREANRRYLEYQAGIQTLQVDLMTVRNDAAKLEDEQRRDEITAAVANSEGQLAALQGRLVGLDGKIEQKKRERLSYYRAQLAQLRQPIDGYSRSVTGLMSSTGGVLAQVAAAEMADLERQVFDYAKQADLGIVDVEYRATLGSTREIKKLQHEMEKELRELRHLQQGDEGDPPAADADGGE